MDTNTNPKADNQVVNITAEAIEQIKRLIAEEKENNLYLRIGVSAGGCSGMSYSMAFDTEPTANDQNFDYNGVNVVIDTKAIPYLQGTILEYKGGLLGGGFNFNNPNARRSCGCGSSFSC